MASSVNTGSTVSRHFASKIVIMVQSFVILSLTYWIVEEYLNNQYLRQYVSDVFQADGLMFGILGTLLVLGSATGLFVKHRHGSSTVSLEIKTPSPVVRATKVESKKSEADFHPVVAALKADMADRRLSFGSILGSGIEQPTTSPTTGVEVPKTSVLDQLAPNRQATMMGPKSAPIGAPVPQRQFDDLRPQVPAGPRAEQVGGSPIQRPMPVLRTQEQTGSSVLQPPQPPTPQIPTNVTTVITGIMPVQKKKDPAATTEEKPSSSQ